MKQIKRSVIALMLVFILFPRVYAQEGKQADYTFEPIVLCFRFDRALVDSGYMNNRHALRQLDELFSGSALFARVDSIIISSHASPEGDEQYNFRLALRRAIAMKGYLLWKHPQLHQKHILLRPQDKNRAGFRQLIEADSAVPDRYITRHLLSQLRNAAVCVVTMRKAGVSELLEVEDRAVWRMHTDDSSLQKANIDSRMRESYIPVTSQHTEPLFALKTNLLFDAALMPNLEMEVPIGNRWSVNGELMFPWWLLGGDKYCLQILMGGAEGRYWLGHRDRRQVLTGHFLGLYAGGGKYDLQWKENGYQGEFFIAAGISYGYARSIARNLQLEFNIGLGVLRTDYRHYHARNNYHTLQWQENGKYTWLGPTKVKISLVWLLNRKVKKGGER